MGENRSLFPIFKTEIQKVEIIVKNVIIMLSNRIYIDKNGEKKKLLDIDIATKNIDDKGDNTFVLKANNGDQFAIKIIFQKIVTTGKKSTISDFIEDYVQYKKILIANNYNNKVVAFVTGQNIQIFKEASFLEDIITHNGQPKFELLSPSEMENFKKSYNVTEYTIKKCPKNDAVVKYLGLKKKDIFRVVRPSPISGYAIEYKIVV